MDREKTSGGLYIGLVLFLIFLVLKLTDTIDWSWWWVTSPLWIGIVFVISIFILIFGVSFIISLIKNLLK
jgi:hypothetical protein